MIKSYVIYVSVSKRSVESAKKVVEAGKEIGGVDIEMWDGVDKYKVWNELEKKDLNIIPIYQSYTTAGYMDCEAATFLSHLSLWEESVRIDDRILILEHDAIFQRKFVDYEYDGILNLGIPNWGTRKWTDELDDIYIREKCTNEHYPFNVYDDKFCQCDTKWLFGAHAYIITPKEAKKLINDAYNKGIFATDLFIRTEIVNIADQLPHSIKQVADFTLIQKVGKTNFISGEEAWKNYD